MHKRIVNTYACKKAMPTSSTMKQSTKINGKPATIDDTPRRKIIALDMIKSKICPANILAKSLTAREMGLNIKDNSSITNNNGFNQPGTFCGKKIFRKLIPNTLKARIIQPIKKDKLRQNVRDK
jgi:hypothetical protein